MKSLNDARVATGLWLSLGHAYAAEVLAESELDWLLIDAEHSPNDVPTVLAQLQATRGAAADIVVRVPCDEPWIIKQYLDIGVRNLMVPMIDTAEQAAELVRSVRYPAAGRRGVASATARASRFGRVPDYLAEADAGMFVIAQIETPTGVDNIGAIAATEGISAIFVGPSDLSANMGYRGRPTEPAVREAIRHCMSVCRDMNLPTGIIAGSVADAAAYAEWGAAFIAIGSDIALLNQGADRIVEDGRRLLRAPKR